MPKQRAHPLVLEEDEPAEQAQGAALVSPTNFSPSAPVLPRMSATRRPSSDSQNLERAARATLTHSASSGSSSPSASYLPPAQLLAASGPASSLASTSGRGNGPHPSTCRDAPGSSSHAVAAWLLHRGVRVRAKRTSASVAWKPVTGGAASLWGSCGAGCCLGVGGVDGFDGASSSYQQHLRYEEVLAAHLVTRPGPSASGGPKDQSTSFTVYSLGRRGGPGGSWALREHTLHAGSHEQAADWVAAINAGVAAHQADRPRSLLVFINPYSGSGRARHIWESVVAPVFAKARIQVTIIDTGKQDHARDFVASMKPEELRQYDGLVAVGGDGMFQEVVTGLLQHRALNPESMSVAGRMRVGHIPGGSTDAVAYTLHNTRSAEAAALHIALGDRQPLDVGRVDAQDGSYKYFVCQAAYGFLGDVMRFSEGLRALGPIRYDVAGAVQLLQLKSYRMRISYRAASGLAADEQTVCTERCEVCHLAGISPPAGYGHKQVHGLGRHKEQEEKGRGEHGLGGEEEEEAGQGSMQQECEAGLLQPSFGRSGDHTGGGPAAAAAAAPGAGRLGRSSASGAAAAGQRSQQQQQQQQQQQHLEQQPQHKGQGCGDTFAAASCKDVGGASRSSSSASSLCSPALFLPSSSHGVSGGGGSACVPQSSSAAAVAPAAAAAVASAAAAAVAPAAAAAGSEWTSEEGEYVAVMSVVTPCRSDKSKKGIVPHGHLADGRMYLVLVSRCSHVQYTQLLLRLSRKGLHDRCLPFVRVIPVTAVRVKPIGPESSWNVDGELLSNNHVSIAVQRGLVDVFARGVEQQGPGLRAAAAGVRGRE